MSYSKLKIYGNCDINYMWCKNGIVSDAVISNLIEQGITSPTWDNQTVALANFSNDLSASCFDQTKVIVGYKIKRFNVKENVFQNVINIDINHYNTNIVTDYNVGSRTPYEYWIFPIFLENGERILGAPIKSQIVEGDWCNWSVIGLKPTKQDGEFEVDQNNIWHFGLNVENGDLAPQYDKVYEDGYGRFSKGFVGKRNYYKGSLKCLIGEISCSDIKYIHDTIDVLDKWNSFCQSADLKLIRDRKGHVFLADIEDTTFSNMENIGENLTTISFNFRQMDDEKKVSVYELEV